MIIILLAIRLYNGYGWCMNKIKEEYAMHKIE